MSTSFLLIGDVHLRTDENTNDTVGALEFAEKLAVDRRVDAVLFAGDIYEKASTPHERAMFAVLLDLLPVPIYGVRGNHDAHEDLDLFNHIPGNTWAEIPAIVAAGRVDLLLVPWPDRSYLASNGHTGEAGDRAGSAALAAMLRGMVATRQSPDRPLVVLAHLQVLGAISSSAQPLIGKAIEATLGDLQDLGAAAVVLGHVHKPQQLAPGIEYIGSLTCHDFGEEGEQKRVGVFTVEDDGSASVEWVPVPCRRWVTIEARPVMSANGGDCSYQYIGETPHLEPDEAAGLNLRYRYICTEEQQHLFDHAEIERRFAGAHTLKIVPQVERAERVRAAEVAAARSPEEKLAAWGVATGTDITEAHVGKLHELESEVSND